MYELKIAGRVLKRLKQLPPKQRGRVWRVIRGLAIDPRPPGSRGLRTGVGHRLTIGECRVLYAIDDKARIATAYLLLHRGEGYPESR
jgi:mRNA interferase RelE/StbE